LVEVGAREMGSVEREMVKEMVRGKERGRGKEMVRGKEREGLGHYRQQWEGWTPCMVREGELQVVGSSWADNAAA
jgi:hypothetical protein